VFPRMCVLGDAYCERIIHCVVCNVVRFLSVTTHTMMAIEAGWRRQKAGKSPPAQRPAHVND